MTRIWQISIILAILLIKSDAQVDNPRRNDDDDYSEEYDSDPDYSTPETGAEACVCVPFYLCIDGEIVDDGTALIDPRRKVEKSDPPECGPYHMCCRNKETSTIRPYPEIPTNRPNPETSTNRPNPETLTLLPYEHRCGTRNRDGIIKSILTTHSNGEEAEFGEWPWQAAILARDGNDFVFKCGGTLIDERHIITVAHCAEKFMDDKTTMVVRLGEWDTQNTNEFMKHEDFDVEEIIIHPQYRKRNLFNDIAVVRLTEDVVFKPHIDTACLPHNEDDFTGQDCITTGWGTDAYKSGTFSLVMKEVTLPVLGHDECQAMLRKTRLGIPFKLHPGFLCAGGKAGEDACKGDGGGPLVCYRNDNSYTVAGLVAWGIDCGQEGIPGVYVNVMKYIDWITSITQRPIEDYWNV